MNAPETIRVGDWLATKRRGVPLAYDIRLDFGHDDGSDRENWCGIMFDPCCGVWLMMLGSSGCTNEIIRSGHQLRPVCDAIEAARKASP